MSKDFEDMDLVDQMFGEREEPDMYPGWKEEASSGVVLPEDHPNYEA